MTASAIVILVVLCLGVGAIALIIAADRTRYLARFDLSAFRDRQYLAMLPNFLQHLHDARFLTPWPHHLNAVSTTLYRFRLRRILTVHPALARTHFVHHHLALHALLTILKPFIDDSILLAQQSIAAERIVTMSDTGERDRLIRFVARARECHISFHASLSKYDRHLLKEIRAREFFGTLRSANAVFHEHGYDFLPALDGLREWSTLDGSEIAQDLPVLPAFRDAPLPTLAPLPHPPGHAGPRP